jgi:hypothetical protein
VASIDERRGNACFGIKGMEVVNNGRAVSSALPLSMPVALGALGAFPLAGQEGE